VQFGADEVFGPALAVGAVGELAKRVVVVAGEDPLR